MNLSSTLPIRSDIYDGLGILEGLVQATESHLVVEFQTSDGLLGIVKSQPKRLEIPIAAIASIRYCKGFMWLFPRIEIELMDFELLSRFPVKSAGAIQLGVRFGNRVRARAFAASLATARVRVLHDAIDASITKQSLSFTPPPISQVNPESNPRDLLARQRELE